MINTTYIIAITEEVLDITISIVKRISIEDLIYYILYELLFWSGQYLSFVEVPSLMFS